MLWEAMVIVKDVVLTLAGGVAAYVGLRGLSTWRRQLRGNTEYQLAKNTLTSVYEVREAISGVRNSFMQYSKKPDLPQDELKGLSRREQEWHALAQAYQRRWDRIPAAMAKLDVNVLETEAVWGPKIRTKVDPLSRLIGHLLFALQQHLEARNPNGQHQNPPSELAMKWRAILMSSLVEPDEFKEQVNAVIRDIEHELRPHIAHFHDLAKPPRRWFKGLASASE